MASVRRHQEFSPCQWETVPSGSKMGMPLAKDEPVSDAVGTFVINGFSGKKDCTAAERGVRKCQRNRPENTKVSEQGGWGCAPRTRTKTSLQTVMKTMVTQAAFLQPKEDHGGSDTHPSACGGIHSAASAYALKKAVACGEPTLNLSSAGTV